MFGARRMGSYSYRRVKGVSAPESTRGMTHLGFPRTFGVLQSNQVRGPWSKGCRRTLGNPRRAISESSKAMPEVEWMRHGPKAVRSDMTQSSLQEAGPESRKELMVLQEELLESGSSKI